MDNTEEDIYYINYYSDLEYPIDIDSLYEKKILVDNS